MSLETTTFGYRMLGYLTDPTTLGDRQLSYEHVALSIESAANYGTHYTMPAINPITVARASQSNANVFGYDMLACLTDPTVYGDSTLRDINIGLKISNTSDHLASLSARRIDCGAYGSIDWQAVKSAAYIGVGNFGTINLNAGITPYVPGAGLGGGNNVGGASSASGVDATNIDKSDKAEFDRKIRLINKYADNNDTSYTNEITKIKSEINGDYKKGIKKLDELMASFEDKDGLNTAAKELYEEDFETKLNAAKTISDAWAQQIDAVTTETTTGYNVNMASVNKNNILDVLGTFITNTTFENKSNHWEPLINNNFDAIKKALCAKAKDIKKNKNITEQEKQEIDALTNAFKAKNENSPTECYNLFKKLRELEAKLNDTGVQARYGVAEDQVSGNATVATDNYNTEVAEWGKKGSLNVNS